VMALAQPFGRKPSRRRLDVVAMALAPIGILVVLLAQVIAGVPMRALLRVEAALVVVGGTMGALLISYSAREIWAAGRAVARTFLAARSDVDALATTIIRLATGAHRRGLVAIESELDAVADPFLREGVRHAIDEASAEALRSLLAAESAARSAEEESPARVFEAAAGYAPTLGILGAVLGLIDVMRNLAAPGALGDGIAVAFVATVYGVGVANLVLLPLAGRLRERAEQGARRRELMTHGICAIHQRIHPRALAHALRSFGATSLEERTARLLRADPGLRLPA
jgi:chemotaxis protein MotA